MAKRQQLSSSEFVNEEKTHALQSEVYLSAPQVGKSGRWITNPVTQRVACQTLAFVLILTIAVPVIGQQQAVSLSNSYLRVADSPTLEPQQFTIEFRFTPRGNGFGNTNQGPGAAVIMKSREGAGGNYLSSWAFQWSPVDNRINFAVAHQIDPSGANVYASQTIAVGATAHIAGTFDGATLKIYVNGNLSGSVSFPFAGVDYGADDVLIGAANHCCGYDRRFEGEVDDVRIWNYAKSQTEVATGLNCEVISGQSGLLAAWNFNDSGLQDVSGNGHNGSASGSISFVSNPLAPCAPCEAADILQSPAPATVPFGGTAQFNVVATGTGPITYQWRKDGNNLTNGPVGCGGSISGADTSTLVLNTVTSVEYGNYDCVVTNACGNDTSTVAALTITPPPAAADVNHDGQVNGGDIQALVAALLAP